MNDKQIIEQLQEIHDSSSMQLWDQSGMAVVAFYRDMIELCDAINEMHTQEYKKLIEDIDNE